VIESLTGQIVVDHLHDQRTAMLGKPRAQLVGAQPVGRENALVETAPRLPGTGWPI
jgi:hypothetical protein